MLVLERWRGAAIMIGDDIVVRVLRVEGDEVFLKVKAPKETRIQRLEVFQRIEAERLKREAAKAAKKKQ